MKVGLVLGGGGYTGTAFHAGLLSALADVIGFDARDAELIVGTSAGSTSAALLRVGFPPHDYLPRMLGEPLSPAGDRVLAGMGPLARPSGRRSTRRWRPAAPQLLRRMLRSPGRYPIGTWGAALLPAGTVNPEQTGARMGPRFTDWPARATWITAVSLATGRRVVFGRDRKPTLGEAVAASCAVPGYFQPVQIGGERYVDGGAHSITNLDLAAGHGLDLVIASAPMAMTTGTPASASDLLRLPVRGRLRREARQVSRSGTPVLLVAPNRHVRSVMGVNSMDVSRRPRVAKAVYEMVAANHGRLRDLLGPLP